MNEQANAKGATITPNDQLTQLWELLGKGTHQAWPECIYKGDDEWEYWSEPMHDEHALAIARDHIEGWLVEMGCEIFKVQGTVQYSFNEYDHQFHTLTDAVRYALSQQ